MQEKVLALPGEIVKKSNALARCAWPIKSLFEPRLVALVASQVREDDDDFKFYDVRIDDLVREDGGMTHQVIKEVCKELMSRVITIEEKNGWAMYNVFSKCVYNRETRTVSARFDPDMKPHYLKLKSHFTEYNLIEFMLLPSIYSQRMFELLKSWDDQPEVILELDNLYKILDVPDSHKKDFRNFRVRVLEKAHKDIHKHTSLKYEWEPIKKGRAVCGIKFTFNKKRAAIVAKKQKEEKHQKQSATNNQLFSKSLECFKQCNGKCSPQDNHMCKLCQKLHWQTKQMRLPIGGCTGLCVNGHF